MLLLSKIGQKVVGKNYKSVYTPELIKMLSDGRQVARLRSINYAKGNHQMNNHDYSKIVPMEVTYRIGQLAEEFGVTLRTLRFYEDKGLLSPRRIGTTRIYNRSDRGRLKIILLGKRLGFSLADVAEILELYDPENGNVRQLQVSIEKGDQQLQNLQDERAARHWRARVRTFDHHRKHGSPLHRRCRD